jgi:predicted DNA-binding protein (UPF0251 family)
MTLKNLMKLLSIMEKIEEAQNEEGSEMMLNKEQLEGIRVKVIHKISTQIGSKECELSNKELTSLLRLALKNVRSQD